ERVVAPVVTLADIWRGMEQERSGEIQRRMDALAEGPGGRGAWAPGDGAGSGREGAGAELPNVLFGGGEGEPVLGHQASRSNSVVPSAATCADARRAAQHW